MKLEEYFEKHGAARRLAEKTGISSPEISRIRSGKKKITFQNAVLIEYGTEGQIKIEDMIDEERFLEATKYLRQNVSQPQTS